MLTPRALPEKSAVSMYLGPVCSPDLQHAAKHRDQLPSSPSQRAVTRGRLAETTLFTRLGVRELRQGFPFFSAARRVKLADMQDYRVVNTLPTSRKSAMWPMRPGAPSPAQSLKARDPSPVSPPPIDNGGYMRAERPLDSSVIKSYTTVNFNKLPAYDWGSAKAPRKPTNVAADRFYTYTYGKNPTEDRKQEASRSKATPVRVTLSKRKAHVHVSEDQRQTMLRPKSMGVNSKSPRPTVSSYQRIKSEAGNLNNKRLVSRLSEMDDMYDVLDVKPMSTKSKLKSNVEHLYSKLKQSIDLIQSTPRISKSSSKAIRHHRPMKKEQGNYRPLSHTSVHTPTLESPLGQYKDFRSADAYVKYLDSLKEEPRTKSMLTPRGSSAEARYFDSHLSNKLLQSVVDHNRPGQDFPTRTPRSGRREGLARANPRGRREPAVTSESLMQATLQDLIIEPIQVPATRGHDYSPPEVNPDWGVSDFYDEHLMDDYRPPSVSSMTSDPENNSAKVTPRIQVALPSAMAIHE